MKLAHSENRAWNIGKSRWNNKPSYPEQFFMQVIENEFNDKNYEKEVPFYKFSLDFLWRHKKKVIEIDGEQHTMDEKQIKRDQEKNELLLKDGFLVLRIRWIDMFHKTKEWIKIAKDFIDIDDFNLQQRLSMVTKIHKTKKLSKDEHKAERKARQLKRSQDHYKDRIEIIKNSNIDYTRLGWVEEVSNLIKMPHHKVRPFMEKYFPDIKLYSRRCQENV